MRLIVHIITYVVAIVVGLVPYVLGLAAFAASSNWIMFVVGMIFVPVGWINGLINLVAGVF